MIYTLKIKLKLFFLLPISILSFAQFNTLTHFNNDKIQTEKEYQQRIFLGKEKQPIQQKKIRSLKKNALKKENDSLKAFIDDLKKKLNTSEKSMDNENKNIDFKKIEDSLLHRLQTKVLLNKENKTTYKSIKTYDFISEPQTISKISMPLNRMVITSPFGFRFHPILGGRKMHNGIDLGANYQNVYAVLDGVITEAGWDNNGGGNYIKIRHSNRFETSYLHLSQIYYRTGETVKAGYIIGKSGNSGNSTAPHLHFAVKEFGVFINPTEFLNHLIKVNNLIALYNGK